MKKIVLDTNCYTAYLKGDKNVLNVLNNAEIIFIPIFVLGELFTGFKGGTKENLNKTNLKIFLEKPTVLILNTTLDTANIFGDIKNKLKKSGTPIPINDIWIASLTMENGAFLVTYDKHFTNVAGLLCWEYV